MDDTTTTRTQHAAPKDLRERLTAVVHDLLDIDASHPRNIAITLVARTVVINDDGEEEDRNVLISNLPDDELTAHHLLHAVQELIV